MSNVFEVNEPVVIDKYRNADPDYIKRTEECPGCDRRYAKKHLDEMKRKYGEKLCCICIGETKNKISNIFHCPKCGSTDIATIVKTGKRMCMEDCCNWSDTNLLK